MAAVSKLQGQRKLLRALSKLERQLAPRAMANALNKTATKAKQQIVSDARKANPKRKAKDLRKYVRTERAKAPDKLVAKIHRDAPSPSGLTAKGVPLSSPFVVESLNDHVYARGLRANAGYRGKGWSADRSQPSGQRPRTSPPNLPIFRVGISSTAERAIRNRKVLLASAVRAAKSQMQTFLPGEFRRQLARQVSRIQARGR